MTFADESAGSSGSSGSTGSSESKPRRDIFGAAIVAALIALALAFGAQRGRRAVPVAARAGDVNTLVGTLAKYTFLPTAGRLEVVSVDGRSRIDLDMSIVIDGVERPLAMRRGDVHLKNKSTLTGEFPIELGEEHANGTLEIRTEGEGMVSASLAVVHEAGASAHTYALRFGLAPDGRTVFVPSIGEIGDVAALEARTVVVDDDTHPFAVVSTQGTVSVAEIPPETDQAGARPRVVVSGRTETVAKREPNTVAGKPARVDLGVLVGATSQDVWGRVYRAARVNVAKVSGVVTGTKERAHVFALDEEGRPLVRTIVDAQGRFAVEAPPAAVQWYAALEAVHTSAPVRFTPGTPGELRLDVSAGGELAVKVIDGDTGQPIVARLIVKGIDGTLDPSFGPDYRASGAGPLMDVLETDVKTPLPAGRFRVAATKGIEWSVDSENIEIASGHTKTLELALRHVVPTPATVSCDLHVHARPSFDSPVTPEDRVLSLVSAGVDFAVPTEHNIVGDYTQALEVLHLSKQLAHVTGIELTTYNPRFGHFGVFPYPHTGGIPPFKGTNAGALITASRRGDPNRVVQVNHPRLPNGIGYFAIAGFDPKVGRVPAGMRTDFDTIEVYNGYDMANRARVDQVIEDWFAILNLGKRMVATGSSDSHRIQYQWAGYPRTFVHVDPKAAGETGHPIDTKEVVAAIKKGRGFVSSGPIIDLELMEGGKTARPGDEIAARGPVTGKLRVRAAPWVDVASVEIVVGLPPPASAGATYNVAPGSTVSIFKQPVPTRPTQVGKEAGSLAEAQARTLRYETDLSLKIPDGARWLVVLVRGERALDDVLPFMGIQPLGFTNPVWIAR